MLYAVKDKRPINKRVRILGPDAILAEYYERIKGNLKGTTLEIVNDLLEQTELTFVLILSRETKALAMRLG